MTRCTVHSEFKNGRCVECNRRRNREIQAEMRNARRLIKAINPQFDLSVSSTPQVRL